MSCVIFHKNAGGEISIIRRLTLDCDVLTNADSIASAATPPSAHHVGRCSQKNHPDPIGIRARTYAPHDASAHASGDTAIENGGLGGPCASA